MQNQTIGIINDEKEKNSKEIVIGLKKKFSFFLP